MKYDTVYDRIRGALYGVAIGDALGGPLEFMSADLIKRKHGRVTEMIGGGWLGLKPGEVTDDTQMTLAVARGVVESPGKPVPAIGRHFIKWYKSGPKDVGGTCATAIHLAMGRAIFSAVEWIDAGEEAHVMLNGRSAGNGALMRTIYPAVYYADPVERAQIVDLISRMTHASVESRRICVEYADAVHKAIFGGHPICTIDPSKYKPGADPSGYVVDTWNNVIEAVLKMDDFEDTVVEAVNRGGDADTIGAIAGGLAGACYGYHTIPERWIECLDPDLRRELDELAEVAYEANVEYYRGKYRGLFDER